MNKTESLNALNCPNCGAPLEFTENQALVRCGFCGSRIERSNEAPTSDDEWHELKASLVDGRIVVEQSSRARRFVIKMRGGHPIVIEDSEAIPPVVTPASYTTPTERTSRLSSGGCVGPSVVLFILLVTLVPIGFALVNTAQVGSILKLITSGKIDEALTAVPTIAKNIHIGNSGALVPSEMDGLPDIIVLTNQRPVGGEGPTEHRLMALRSAEPTFLWQSQPLGKGVYDVPILASLEFVYTLVDDRLLALHRTGGETAWEATLSDKVSLSLCKNCVRLLNDRLFTLSDDGTLQAFDARTGAPLWDFRANQDSPRGLYLLDGRPAFMDNDENNDGILRAFDPASGQMQIVQPVCPSEHSWVEYADWTTPIYQSTGGARFYLLFDQCIQSWDARTLEQIWNTPVPVWFHRDAFPLITEEAFYISLGEALVAVNATSGEPKVLVEDEDYEFVPLAVEGDALIVRAIRMRGSRRSELWAADKGSGERRWTFDLGDNPPLDPPYANTSIVDEDEPVWTWHITPEGLVILRIKADEDDVSHAILLETLDLETGAGSDQQEIRLGVETIVLSAPEFTIWMRDTVWMSIEGKLLGLDVAAGKIIYRWP